MGVMKKLIIGNWKMNPSDITKAKRIFVEIRKKASTMRNVETIVCPPFLYINILQKLVTGHRCVIGAQDAFWEPVGAFTGEVSPFMLAEAGVKYVILGHSERRALGDGNDIVSKKVNASLRRGLKVILCVGEGSRDSHGRFFSFIEKQLKESLAGVKVKDLKDVIVAYEPLWAIGKNATRGATADEFTEMIIFIRKVLADMFNKKEAMKIPIIYGGSVDHKNAKEFLEVYGSGGLLPGRASLDPKKFNAILEIANSIKK